jgi:hypothetical protein
MEDNMKIVVSLAFVFTLLSGAPPAWAAKTPSCGTDVSLSVVIDGTLTVTSADTALFPAGTNYAIVSDGGGAYVDGARMKGGALSAIFQVDNCTYDFTMNLVNLARKAYIRDPSGTWVQMTFFNFDRVASVPGLGTALSPDAQAFCGGVVLDPSNTNRPYTDPSTGVVYDNSGGCVLDGATNQYYVRRAANISVGTSGGTSSRYGLNPPYFSTNGVAAPNLCTASDPRCTTSFIRVYHPDANHWTLATEDVPAFQPSTPPTPDDWVAGHQTCGNTCTVDGYVSLPLKVTVTRR